MLGAWCTLAGSDPSGRDWPLADCRLAAVKRPGGRKMYGRSAVHRRSVKVRLQYQNDVTPFGNVARRYYSFGSRQITP
jgi:hypothetical protein